MPPWDEGVTLGGIRAIGCIIQLDIIIGVAMCEIRDLCACMNMFSPYIIYIINYMTSGVYVCV